jgi:hypothetical protein
MSHQMADGTVRGCSRPGGAAPICFSGTLGKRAHDHALPRAHLGRKSRSGADAESSRRLCDPCRVHLSMLLGGTMKSEARTPDHGLG